MSDFYGFSPTYKKVSQVSFFLSPSHVSSKVIILHLCQTIKVAHFAVLISVILSLCTALEKLLKDFDAKYATGEDVYMVIQKASTFIGGNYQSSTLCLPYYQIYYNSLNLFNFPCQVCNFHRSSTKKTESYLQNNYYFNLCLSFLRVIMSFWWVVDTNCKLRLEN